MMLVVMLTMYFILLQSKKAMPYLIQALTRLTEMFSKMIQVGQREMYLENDFIHVSAETSPAYNFIDMTVYRPHSAIVLDSLMETHWEPCNSSVVTIKVGITARNKTLFIPQHRIVAGYYGITLVVGVSIHLLVCLSIRLYFCFQTMSKCPWIFTKLAVCIDIIEI